MSYTMHSPSQGYSMPFAEASADVYASRAYGSHLMAQNYSAYLNRDDPYHSGHGGLHGTSGHYGGPSGPGPSPGLQSAHGSVYGGGGGSLNGGLSGSGIPQQTYPTLPPISHFPHQQDLYSSCLGQRTPSHSLSGAGGYGSSSAGTSSLVAASLSRQHPGSKAYWESVQAAQQQQNSCYGSAGSTPSHKNSPQTASAHWSHSPNVLSSPSSSTPSPIPCPSTPHHNFNTSSSPLHHQQQHSQQSLVDASPIHKAYNGLMGSGRDSSGASSSGSGSNPLQSLQKMVQIDSESSNDIRVQYEAATAGPPLPPMGSIGPHSNNIGGGPPNGPLPMEQDPNFPTYYNLDQNRMCATPGYQNIGPPPAAHQISGGQTPFSPKNGPLPQQEHHRSSGLCSSKSIDSENGSNSELAMSSNSQQRAAAASLRFNTSKLAKDGNPNSTNFLNNRSCSTETVCSGNSGGGSPSTVGSVKSTSGAASSHVAPAVETGLLNEQTHDSVNSFRGSESTTANSRDSIKSSDSESAAVQLSSYVSASQCPTPNTPGGAGSNWKLNNSTSNDFRSTDRAAFSGANGSVQSSKAWWPENAPSGNAISPSTSRSFTPHLSDCSVGGGGQFGGGNSNYSSGLPHGNSSSGGAHASSSSARAPTPSLWSQSKSSTPQPPSSSATAQMMNSSGTTSFAPDGTVIVKKKRGRPFGSKNRRNIDQAAAGSGSATASGPLDVVHKRKRKNAHLVDACVNTTLTFDMAISLNMDDCLAFETASSSSLKYAVPLAMKRKKIVGPVVRIEAEKNDQHEQNQNQEKSYSVLNNCNDEEETSKAAVFASQTSSSAIFGKPVGVESICLPPPTSGRKNSALTRKCTINGNSSSNGSNGNVSSTANNTRDCSSPPSPTWICVLCHKGPHYRGLGDLYGPYSVQLEKSKLPNSVLSLTDTAEHSSNGQTEQLNAKDEESTEQAANQAPVEQSACERRSLRRRVDSSNSGEESKGKQSSSANTTSTVHPATEELTTSKDTSAKVSLEVWIHEDCIVWSNNVFLEGTTIRNLEPAIVESFASICSKCKLPGATLSCIYKSCTVSPLHYLCAKEKDCDLDEEKFILSCSKHKKRRLTAKEFEVVEVSEATTTATISES